MNESVYSFDWSSEDEEALHGVDVTEVKSWLSFSSTESTGESEHISFFRKAREGRDTMHNILLTSQRAQTSPAPFSVPRRKFRQRPKLEKGESVESLIKKLQNEKIFFTSVPGIQEIRYILENEERKPRRNNRGRKLFKTHLKKLQKFPRRITQMRGLATR
eukprot:snap_masked-scaffold_10-processed-gene-11.21-mRNA-1 protein AED:1.00 eAED:1.00 QI:0/-1/0/0/-1/1/1/0/160